jgi:toxin FitB
VTGPCPVVTPMVLLDTNIFIYISQGKLPATTTLDTDIAHASVTQIEALGYSRLTTQEMHTLSELFDRSYTLDLIQPIVQTAIALRQRHAMSLGDAIIAATALEHQVELWTANNDDFLRIDDLQVLNPLSQEGGE